MTKQLQLTTPCYQATLVGLEVVGKSSKPQWEAYGDTLKTIDEAKQWIIGDWLVDGKRHYGDGLYSQAARLLGMDEHTLHDLKGLVDKFQLEDRSANVSHTHYLQVSALKPLETDKKTGKVRRGKEHDMEAAQKLLKQAEKENWSVRDLKAAVAEHVRRQDEAIRLANEPERFSVILADPAWEYDFSKSDNRQIGNQYTPTSLYDMQKLQVPAASDSVLFMWATSPKLREALELMAAWGFEYKTCMVWVKDKIGMGYYARQKHELLLIGSRGSGLELPDEATRPASVFEAPRGEHSEKPEIVYEIIERMYPQYKKLEMFARQPRDGWASWGDEL